MVELGYNMQCASPYTLKEPDLQGRAQIVPCGNCGACRANRRASWTFRLKEELKDSSSCIFVTLTYDDENLPYAEEPTLVKADVQKWMKRLRKRQEKYTDIKVRYYLVGEYGTNTKRPHYHAILFNTHIKTIKELYKTWKFGHIKIDPVGDATIHYITKYHLNYDKKARKGIKEPEFALMSRRPAIGAGYLERNKEYHQKTKNDFVVLNGYKQSIPRYYRDKMFSETTRNELNETRKQENKEIEWEELERLEKLGHKQPAKELKKRIEHKASIQKNKGKENLF